MAFFTTNWIFLAMCGLGYTIATIETYKSFFFPNKPRGKFAGKPILYPKMLERRRIVAVLYATIWLAIITLLVLAFRGPHYGLLGCSRADGGSPLRANQRGRGWTSRVTPSTWHIPGRTRTPERRQARYPGTRTVTSKVPRRSCAAAAYSTSSPPPSIRTYSDAESA